MSRQSLLVSAPLGALLRLDRLEHRADRLALVVEALRERMRAHQRTAGAVPPPLRHAVDGFEQELHAVRHELSTLRRRVARGRDA